jgi:serine O-acetyltransferase
MDRQGGGMQFRYLKHDLYRYFYPDDAVLKVSLWKKLEQIVFTQAIWVIVVYRFQRWVMLECRIPVVKHVLRVVSAPVELLVQTLTGINIQAGCEIGPGLYIGHYGTIFIHGDVKLGKFCNISQENTFGIAGRGDKRGVPEIGDFIYIGPGAKIIGKVKVGNHAAIGANAVVTRDVPDCAVVAGVPAKVLSYKSSKDFVEFNREKHKEFV